MKLIRFTIFLTAVVLIPLKSSSQRVAWVVGNSDYVDGTLSNPVNDARLVSDSLKSLGFEVQVDLDLKSADEFGASAQRVLSNIGGTEVFLFYYAGHGIQVDNENYLIPTQADPKDEYGIKRECFPITELISRYQNAYSDIPFVAVLDACRVNPFERKWSRSYGSGKGLSKMPAPTGSLIAYSTEYGTTAADGDKVNSDYALAFAQAIGQPGFSVQEAFQEVRRLVLEASNDVQVPVEQNKLTAPLILRQLPDLSALQMAGVFADFEKVLTLGFKENALLTKDSLIGVDRKHELVRHYASELDSSQPHLVSWWRHLELFHLLYQLQASRGADDEVSLFTLRKTLENHTDSLDPEAADLAREFSNLLRIELAPNGVSLSELDGVSITVDELKFSASYWLENLLFPEIDFQFKGVQESRYSELKSSFLETEFILTFEALAQEAALSDVFTNWSAESIEKMVLYHYLLASKMADPQDRTYSMSMNFSALAKLCLSDPTDREKAKALQKILKRSWVDRLLVVFDARLDIEGFPEVADAVEIVLSRLNDLLDEEVIKITPDMNQALGIFFERELPKALDACSGSFFDFYKHGRLLIDRGALNLVLLIPDDEEFAVNLIDRWDCFVLAYLSNDQSNELDVLLDDFLEKSWLEVDSTFDETEISFTSWQSLSESHLSLLRLTNKVTSQEFPLSARRFATATRGSWNNHQLVAFLQECWNVLALSNDDVFQSFGKEYGDYSLAIHGPLALVQLIQDDELTCSELIQLKFLLESLLRSHFKDYATEGTPLSYADIPQLLSAYESCRLQYGLYSDCQVDLYDWQTRDSLNFAISQYVFKNPIAEQYFKDEEVAEGIVAEFINLGNFKGLLDFYVLKERLFNSGSINSGNSKAFMTDLLDRSLDLKADDEDGLFEYELIALLGDIVSEASEDMLVGRKPFSLSEQNISFAIDLLQEFAGSGSDKWNRLRAHGTLVNSQQSYYHRNGKRVAGSPTIIESAGNALKAYDTHGIPLEPTLIYIQAEELSCMADYGNSIPKWKACINDYEYWESSDYSQFAQNLFLDLLEYEGVSDTLYDQLFMQCGMSPNAVEGGFSSAEIEGDVLTLRSAIGDALPILEFTNASGQSTVLLQRPDLQWKIYHAEEKLGAIMTRRDTTYVPCHGYSFGQIDITDAELGDGIVVYSNQTRRETSSQWKIQLPAPLLPLTDFSDIRTGFYWGGVPPTGHTQDLKHLTYLESYNP